MCDPNSVLSLTCLIWMDNFTYNFQLIFSRDETESRLFRCVKKDCVADPVHLNVVAVVVAVVIVVIAIDVVFVAGFNLVDVDVGCRDRIKFLSIMNYSFQRVNLCCLCLIVHIMKLKTSF